MKRLIAVLISATLLISLIPAALADGSANLGGLLAACGEPVFDGSAGKSLTDWGFEPEYADGMSLEGGEGRLQFKKTAGFTSGGNLTLSPELVRATNAENSDFVVLTFRSFSELEDVRNENEHIYTFYGDTSNTSGKEILKFKYRVRGLLPCTAENQDKDEYGGAILEGGGVPVRIFLLRDGDRFRYIYQVYDGGWATAYEGSAGADRFAGGLGTVRAFVQYGGENVPTGLDDLKIYAGRYGDAVEPVRNMEYLDRGLAVMKTDGGIYLSWRLTGTEEYDAEYTVYRNGEPLATVGESTNYIDEDGTADDEYSVAPAGGQPCPPKKAFSSGENYFDIPLSQPPAATMPNGETVEYSPWDATAGDLDGDGEYELIQRWDAPRRHAADAGYTGGLVLDAYKQDGSVLWRIDLGVNIRCNTENVFSVYDYNGDGIAELAAKTAPGSMDGTGRYVTEASLIDDIKNADNSRDYRDANGKVLSGPEFYTVFDGRNGKALDTVYYPIPRGDGQWGDRDPGWGHRGEKYFDVPAYLDGVHPYIVLWRGIYPAQNGSKSPARTAAAAFRMEGGRLRLEYSFDTMPGQRGYSPGNENYVGQGNHNISVGDVDFDGLDEIVSGGLCLDNDLTALWCSGRGHGDAQHLGNYDPTTDGLEFMTVHEHAPYGMTVYNAATGETLGHWDGGGDTGRGVMANVGAGGYYQLWGAGTYQSNGGKDFSETRLTGQSYNFRIFWDGDVYDELLDAVQAGGDNTPYISSYNSESGHMDEIFRAWDTETVNTTKSTPALTADILGDWREELIAVREDYKALRVFVSPIYTENKLYTLMHDPQYRQSIAWEHQYYNQPPHISFYLSGDGDDERAEKPRINAVRYSPAPFDAALPVKSGELEPPKVPDENKVIDLDGDYFHAFEIISWQGGSRTLGGATLSVASSGRYKFSYAAAANLRYPVIKNSGGLEARDGKFIVLATGRDENVKYTISGESAVQSGRLHYDFAFPKEYTYNGDPRGGNDARLKIGGDIDLFYDRETTSLHFGGEDGELIHAYAGLDDAQRWTALDADIDAANGSVRLKLTFPGGTVYEKELAVSARPIGEISFTTYSGQYNWGCILLDNVTLDSDGGVLWLSSGGGSFISHDFEPVSGEFTADFDLIPYETADGVVGLAGEAAKWYDGLNISLQLGGDGLLKARNGGAFEAVGQVRYSPGEKYRVHIEGDTAAKRYGVWVTGGDGVTRTLASDYAFRTGAPDASGLGRLYVLGGDGVDGGKFAVTDFTAANAVKPQKPEPAVLAPEVAIAVAGVKPDRDETFVFSLTADPDNPPGAVLPEKTTVSVTGEGTAAFDGITFTEAGVYGFTVAELKGNAADYTYDSGVWTLTATVTEDGPSLKAAAVYTRDGREAPRAEFVNSYDRPGIVSARADGGVLYAKCVGEAYLYAAQYDGDGALVSVEKRRLEKGVATEEIALAEDCAGVTLYLWDGAMSPFVPPVTVDANGSATTKNVALVP